MESKSKENKPKIVVLGSCSVDFTTFAPRLPTPGETIHGNKFMTSFGGKGANQCVAATKLGGNTHMICRLGDDHWGKEYKDYLKDMGVNVTHSHITPNVNTGIAQISVAKSAENQIVIVPGANGILGKSDVKEAEELIKQADVLIGQLETPFETTLEAFKLNSGIRLLNAAPAKDDIKDILPYCSVLCVNESEASILTNMSVNLINVKIAAVKLMDMGCKSVIITLGKDGAVYASSHQNQVIQVDCDKVIPVDTTGAGDAFVGALATFLVNNDGYPMHQIVGAACHIASISVTKEGTQTSYPTNYNAFDKEYNYSIL